MALVEFQVTIVVDPPSIGAGVATNVDTAGVAGVRAGDFVDAQAPDTIEAGRLVSRSISRMASTAAPSA